MVDVEKKKEELYTFLVELEQDIKILQDNILKVKEDVKDMDSEEELKMFVNKVDIECDLKYIELFVWKGSEAQ